MNIVLIGFKGAGKSTVAPLLAGRLGCGFDDLDRMVGEAASKILGDAVSFREAFRRLGEPEFRKLERGLLSKVLARKRFVIALGGGAALDPAAREALRAHCVVYLRAPESDLVRRVQSEDWPAYLDGETDPEAALRNMMAERLPQYDGMCDIVVDCPDGATPAAVAEEAGRQVSEWLESHR